MRLKALAKCIDRSIESNSIGSYSIISNSDPGGLFLLNIEIKKALVLAFGIIKEISLIGTPYKPVLAFSEESIFSVYGYNCVEVSLHCRITTPFKMDRWRFECLLCIQDESLDAILVRMETGMNVGMQAGIEVNITLTMMLIGIFHPLFGQIPHRTRVLPRKCWTYIFQFSWKIHHIQPVIIKQISHTLILVAHSIPKIRNLKICPIFMKGRYKQLIQNLMKNKQQ